MRIIFKAEIWSYSLIEENTIGQLSYFCTCIHLCKILILIKVHVYRIFIISVKPILWHFLFQSLKFLLKSKQCIQHFNIIQFYFLDNYFIICTMKMANISRKFYHSKNSFKHIQKALQKVCSFTKRKWQISLNIIINNLTCTLDLSSLVKNS